jgi:site-specific recombinase XerD
MSEIAPLLEGFFTERLQNQLQVSPNTVAAYRDAFRLLLRFAQDQLARKPSELLLEDIDAGFVSRFLDHLENERGNTVRTRNARLAAIHSFFRYAALKEPANGALIQRVLAIPQKRFERNEVAFLTPAEIDAFLASPDKTTVMGRRDYTLMLTAIETGLRVSELTSLKVEDVVLGHGKHVRCRGKGRKERCTPLTAAAARAMSVWLKARNGRPSEPVFPGRRGGPLSRDAVERVVAKHAAAASRRCPSLRNKRTSPHVLRHTTAMQLLRSGVDQTVLALWLGHEKTDTTAIYLKGDLTIKEKALAALTPLGVTPGRYKPPDKLLAFLRSL